MSDKEEKLNDAGEEKGSSMSKKTILIITSIVTVLSIIAIVVSLVKFGDNPKKKKNEDYDPIPEKEDINFNETYHRQLTRQFAAEGMVLASNNGLLPLEKTDKVVLFGLGTVDTIHGGSGAAEIYQKGTTTKIKAVTVKEGIENKHKENKFDYEENNKGYLLPGNETNSTLTESDIEEFAKKSGSQKRSVAIFAVSRRAGEFSDRRMDHYENGTVLSAEENSTYDALVHHFDSVVVVLNVPGVMETGRFYNNTKTSILIAFYPGVEAGNAIADLLVGDVNPSGHLSDTWALQIGDYPTTKTMTESLDYVKYKEGLFMGYRYFEDDQEKQKKVAFPFGHGLSYTTFKVTSKCSFSNDIFTVTATVENTGKRAGKQVVQVYAEKPQNEKFIKVKRELVAFGKTKELKPQESTTLTLTFKLRDLASYDETGVLGYRACYILEKGDYNIYVGTSVAEVRGKNGLIFTHKQNELRLVEKLSNRIPPKDDDVKDANTKPNFDSFMKDNNEQIPEKVEEEETEKNVEEKKVEEKKMETITVSNTKDDYPKFPTNKVNPINFKTVLTKKNTMKELVDQMSNEEMAFLAYGHDSFVRGGTGTIGGYYNTGITAKYLIPSADTNDGPAGIRHSEVTMQSVAWPCGTLIASSFNTEMQEKIAEETAKEARRINSTFWLAPGLNLHRSPLCGRGFEYLSEDPVLSGKMGIAATKGIQKLRVAVTIKHFAFNGKEDNRGGEGHAKGFASDSRLAERVARELYLKQFEMVVKEAKPWAIMTSYNAVNGGRTMESYDLLTGILRNEWKFDGLIMTDWSANTKIEREVHAGSNVRMPTGSSEQILEGLASGMITEKQLRESTLYTLNTIAKTCAIDKLFKNPEPIKLNVTKTIKIAEHMYYRDPKISYEECKEGGYNPTNTARNTWISLYINNEKEGYRRARIHYSAKFDGFGVVFRRNEDALGEITNLKETGDYQTWATSPDFSIYLPKGTYELTLQFLGYDYIPGVDPHKGNIDWLEIDI